MTLVRVRSTKPTEQACDMTAKARQPMKPEDSLDTKQRRGFDLIDCSINHVNCPFRLDNLPQQPGEGKIVIRKPRDGAPKPPIQSEPTPPPVRLTQLLLSALNELFPR